MRVSSNNRVDISPKRRKLLSEFFDGLGCVVTGIPIARASLHHLSGDPSESEFPNLLPLTWDLHAGLKLNQPRESVRPELREENLIEAAEKWFKKGATTKAYGCIRLAHALSAHFYKPHDPETEFRLAAHSLYFLRRSVQSVRFKLIIQHLEYILSRELRTALQRRRMIPPFGAFCLLIELGSWLNELGWPNEGLSLLRTSRSRLRAYQNSLTAKDVSRFQRQIANALVHVGQYGRELEYAIRLAGESGDASENNQYALDTVRMNLYLTRGSPKAALKVLKQRFDRFEKETGFWFGKLDAMPQTIQTSLGYIALSLICESQLIRTAKHRSDLARRIRALKRHEGHYGVTAALNQTPGLQQAAHAATLAFPPLNDFLIGRAFPSLPKRVAELVSKIASQL